MTPKVKIKSEIFEDGRVIYTVRSKDLIAAMQRATIILIAVGGRFTHMEYAIGERVGKADRHYFYIYA